MGRDVTVARKVLKWASFWQWGGAALKDVAVLLTDPESWNGPKFRRLSRWKAPPRQDEPEYLPDYGPRIYRIDPATQAMEIAFRLYVPREFGVEVQIRGSFTWGRWRAMEDLGDGLYEHFRERIMPGDWYEFRVRDAAGAWTEVTDPMAYRFAKQFDWETQKYNSHALVPSVAYDMQSSAPELTRGLVICECTLPGLLHGLLPETNSSDRPDGPSIVARLLENDVAAKLRERGFTGVMFPIQASVANLWDYKWKFNYLVSGLGAIDAELGDWDEMKRLVDSFHAAGILVIPDIILVHHVKDSSTRGIEKLKDSAGRSLWFDDNPFLFRDYGTWMLNLENPQIRNHLIEMVVRFIQELHLGAFRFDYVDGLVFQYALGHREVVPPAAGVAPTVVRASGATSGARDAGARDAAIRDVEAAAGGVRTGAALAADAPAATGESGRPGGSQNVPAKGNDKCVPASIQKPDSKATAATASDSHTRDADVQAVDAQVSRFVEHATSRRPRVLTAGEKLLEELVKTLDAYNCKAIRFSEAFSSRQVPSVRRMASVFYEPWVGVVAMSDLMNGKALADCTDVARSIAGVAGVTTVHRPIDVMTYVMSHDEAAVDKDVMSARRRGGVPESAGGHLAELLHAFADELHARGKLTRGEKLDFVARHAVMLESLAMFSGNFAHLQLNGASDAMQLGAYDQEWPFVWDVAVHPVVAKWVERTGRSPDDVSGVLREHGRRMAELRRIYNEFTPLNTEAPRGQLEIEVVGQWDHPASFAFLRTDPGDRVSPLLMVYNFGGEPISLFRTMLPALPAGRWSTEFAQPGRPDALGRLIPCVVGDGASEHLQLVLPGHSMAIFREDLVRPSG